VTDKNIREMASGKISSHDNESPDWREANEYLLQEVGEEVYCSLRFSRGHLSMNDAKILATYHRGRK